MGFTHQLRNGGNDDVESSQSSNRSRAIIADCWLWMSVSSNEAGAVRLFVRVQTVTRLHSSENIVEFKEG